MFERIMSLTVYVGMRGGGGAGGGRACISDCHYKDVFNISYYYSKV